jgi:uncharacterized protein YvpB
MGDALEVDEVPTRWGVSRRSFVLAGAATIAAGWLGRRPRPFGPSVVEARADAEATSRVLDVPVYRQAFPLSCEAASLRMALAYRGVSTDDAAILQLIGSDGREPFYRDGVLRWGDPYTTFVGDVTGSEVSLTGYGTYYPTIAKAAAALGGSVLAAADGITPGKIYSYLLDGHPAIVWITYQWVAARRSDYVAFDGTAVPYAGPVEHSVTLAGVDSTGVLVNDPEAGQYWIPKSTFESVYQTYNQMAVVLA